MRGSGPGSRVCSLSGCRRSWGEPATEEEAQGKETVRRANLSDIHRLVPSFAWSSATARRTAGSPVKISVDCTRVHGHVSIRNFRIMNVSLFRRRRCAGPVRRAWAPERPCRDGECYSARGGQGVAVRASCEGSPGDSPSERPGRLVCRTRTSPPREAPESGVSRGGAHYMIPSFCGI